jgi:hypothetical protein
MKAEGDRITFSSGLVIRANVGIIGLSPSLNVFEGYDGVLGDDRGWTPEEAVELADHMIARWRAFKAMAAKRRTTNGGD